MLGRHTTDGRFENEIQSNFLSKKDAMNSYQRRKILKRPATIEDLEENEQGVFQTAEGAEIYLRLGKSIFKQTFEKVG